MEMTIDHPATTRAARTRAASRPRAEHTTTRRPAEEREPNFARGIGEDPPERRRSRGRFSEGEEELPDTPEKHVERRFSEGIEQSPTSD